eukprot:TRINITY_DN3933_c1_g1_i1.p1 TRINITY_DN3933_c1_g1~~TRINITY_DN3933_c1_g1_i1.p1  ORF type:complete len:339 (+),score=116.47 TRINITY_DN3933_c1_g1_i1:705-1721(+)
MSHFHRSRNQRRNHSCSTLSGFNLKFNLNHNLNFNLKLQLENIFQIPDIFRSNFTSKIYLCLFQLEFNLKNQRLSKTLSERHLYKLSEISGGDHFNLESEFSDEFLDQLLDFVKFITPSSLEDRASEIPVPKGIAESPANVVSNFLTAIGMEKYRDQFLSAGYYDKYAISVIGESDLDAIGVTDESHRQVILKACKEVDTLTPQLPSNGILPSPQQSMLRSRSSHHVTSPISPTYSLHSNMDSTALRKSPSNDSLPSHLRSMSETPPFEIRSFGVGEDRIVRLESQVAIQQETIDDLTYRVTAASEIIREQSQQISALYDDLNEMKNLLRALRTEKLN